MTSRSGGLRAACRGLESAWGVKVLMEHHAVPWYWGIQGFSGESLQPKTLGSVYRWTLTHTCSNEQFECDA